MNAEEIVAKIQQHATRRDLRLTLHAHQEMVEEGILLGEVLQALAGCQLLEEYPDDRRGPSCLVLGYTHEKRPIHVVCRTLSPS